MGTLSTMSLGERLDFGRGGTPIGVSDTHLIDADGKQPFCDIDRLSWIQFARRRGTRRPCLHSLESNPQAPDF